MSINFHRCRTAVLAVALSLVAAAVFAVPTADELLVSLDKSQTFDSSFANAMMTIVDKFGTRKTEFKVWSRGKDDTFMEFTSAAERGQKILRNAKELYLFFPDAEEVTRLQGSALRQSMAGSDISYEDMTGTRNRAQNYNAALLGTEQFNGRNVYRLDLRAKTRNVAYARQEAWLDTSTYLPVQVKFYDLSGKGAQGYDLFRRPRNRGLSRKHALPGKRRAQDGNQHRNGLSGI